MREKVLASLRERLSQGDLGHCARVESLARELAEAHGLDVERCGLAALAHDYARSTPLDELAGEARRFGIPIGEVERAEPYLLHAYVGAAMLRDELDIQDKEILGAVASHTLGRAGMTEMEAVVFVADHLEPGRRSSWAEEARELARTDLWEASALCLGHIISSVVDKRRLLHERSVESYNHLLIHRLGHRPPIIGG